MNQATNDENTKMDGNESMTILIRAGKVISFIVVLVPAVLSILTFLNTQRLETNRTFLNDQFSLYKEAVDITSKLSTKVCGNNDEKCSTDYLKSCQRFRELFWGSLGVVEDGGVEAAMVAFREKYMEFQPKICDPIETLAFSKKPKPAETGDKADGLANRSLKLAHCVNASIRFSRNMDLPEAAKKCGYSDRPRWLQYIFNPSKI